MTISYGRMRIMMFIQRSPVNNVLCALEKAETIKSMVRRCNVWFIMLTQVALQVTIGLVIWCLYPWRGRGFSEGYDRLVMPWVANPWRIRYCYVANPWRIRCNKMAVSRITFSDPQFLDAAVYYRIEGQSRI